MTKKIMEISIAIFFLACSVIAVVFGSTLKTHFENRIEIENHALQIQKNTIKELESTINVLLDGSYAVIARGLESEGLLSPTDASEIVGGAIKSISAKSERLGVITKALNDAYLKER
jgi:hypothetical protein